LANRPVDDLALQREGKVVQQTVSATE
jgi:hypothetical protein